MDSVMIQDAGKINSFKGKKFDEMSKEELVGIIKELFIELNQAYEDHKKSLQMIIGI